MGRMARDSRLETRKARNQLVVRKEPYWRSVYQGAHIGYYKGGKSGAWIARYRHAGDTKYTKKTLGKADDIQDANGVNILDYKQANESAQKWFKEQGLIREGHLPSGTYTVRDAVNDYGEWFRNHRKSWDRTLQQIEAHILPELGDIEVSKLTTAQLREWHQKIANSPPRLRTGKYATQQNYGALNNDEARRKRKSTANRILTILKAALNKAYEDGKVAHDDVWRRVKPFEKVDSARIRYLKMDEIRRLVNAAEPEFKPMIQAGLYTACRYSEIASMKVHDFDLNSGTVFIPDSKSGNQRHVILNSEGQLFFKQAVMGKNGNDLIFTHYDGEKWGKSHQTRRLKDACENARITPAISFHILRHTHASHLAMNNVPLTVIAKQLGHSDTRIVEKHYAHLATNYIKDTIRANFPDLGITDANNVEDFYDKQNTGRNKA